MLAHFAENMHFLPAFSSSLLYGYALDNQTGHGRGRDLCTRSIFSSIFQEWYGRLMYNTSTKGLAFRVRQLGVQRRLSLVCAGCKSYYSSHKYAG